MDTSIQRQEIPIEKRMDEIMEKVLQIKQPISFYQLFPYQSRTYIVATFLALLELMKQRKINCKQDTHMDDIMVFSFEG